MADVVVAASATEATIRTAIETTAADGDTVVLTNPQNITIVTNPLRIINKAIRIISSTGNPRNCVINGISSQPIIQITNPNTAGATMTRMHIEGVTLSGNGASFGGITWTGTASQGGLRFAAFRNLIINNCLNYGIQLVGASTGADGLVNPTLEGLDISSIGSGVNAGRGIIVTNSTLANIHKNSVAQCGLQGIFLTSCPGLRMTNNSLDSNNTTPTIAGQTQDGNAEVSLVNCNGFMVDGLDATNLNFNAVDDARLVTTALALKNCWGGSVNMLSTGFAAADPAMPRAYALAYINGTRGVRRGTVVTTLMGDNPVLYDRFSPRSIQGYEQPITNLSQSLAATGLPTV